LASSIFLIVLSIAGESHLATVWRVCFGFGILLPLLVLVLRLRMLSSKLYRKGAIKSELNLYPVSPLLTTNGIVTESVPYQLVFKRYWRTLIGTGGAWYGEL
jgi:hypothetical protein